MFFGNYLINDLSKVNKTEALNKVKESTRFSASFIFLLIGSGIVCTLGLLINSTATVIGGMIISPLMWPLMQTSIGISYGRPHYIKRALLLLLFSIAISLLSSFVITYLSPIKILNTEILARTTPTLFDIAIALVSGAVAALAITHPKISESLAGVAIATSLTPPICVSGIGLALSNEIVFKGALLLFVANVISIIFSSILIFLHIGLRNTAEPRFQKRALVLTSLILIVIATPLFFYLKQYSYEVRAYSKAEQVLKRYLLDLSPQIYLSNVKTSVDNSSSRVIVEAYILIPEDMQIAYDQRQLIKNTLEQTLQRPVDLKLRLQRTISVLSQDDVFLTSAKEQIEQSFLVKLNQLDVSLAVDSLDIFFDEPNASWIVRALLRSDQSTSITYADQQDLITFIEQETGFNIVLDLEIIPRIKIQTVSDELNMQVSQFIQQYFVQNLTNADILSINFSTDEDDTDTITIDVKTPYNIVILNTDLAALSKNIENVFDKEYALEVNVTYFETIYEQ